MSIQSAAALVGAILSLLSAAAIAFAIAKVGVSGRSRVTSERVGWKLLGTGVIAMLAFFVGSMLIALALTPLFSKAERDVWVSALGPLAGAATVLALWKHQGKRRRVLGIRRDIKSAVPAAVALAIPVWLTIVGISVIVTQLFRSMGLYHDEVHPLLETIRRGTSVDVILAVFISAVVSAPLAEELIFRAAIQGGMSGALRRFRGLSDPSRRWIAICFTSVLFSLVHPWWSMPAIFVLSLILGWLYERTGNLWANVLLHALFNGIQTTLVVFMSHAV